MGTYVVALWLDVPCTIPIGRLGRFAFSPGWYLYVGSALGPGGLPARLSRHWRRAGCDKRLHWHVDYLREYAIWGGAWASYSAERVECAWASVILRQPGARIVARNFGASDCRCPAHLVHMASLPEEDWFARVLGAERVTVSPSEMDGLLQVLVSAGEDAREEAALALGRFGAAAAERLAAILASGDADARWWATRALAEAGPEGVPVLTTALRDQDPDVRACAALALGHTGDGSAADALAEGLGDESAFVASVATDALSMLGEPAIEALVVRLGAEKPHIRLLAVRALGRIGSERVIGPLMGVLEDESYMVRYYACDALEALGVGMVYMAP
jgi:Uri superfamily endonuclease